MLICCNRSSEQVSFLPSCLSGQCWKRLVASDHEKMRGSETPAMSALQPKAECSQSLMGQCRHHVLLGGTIPMPPPRSRDQHIAAGATGVTSNQGNPNISTHHQRQLNSAPAAPLNRRASFSKIPSPRGHAPFSSPFLYIIPYTLILWDRTALTVKEIY